MEGAGKSLGFRSLLLRLIAYSAVTSGTAAGIAAWWWHLHPPKGFSAPGDYFSELAQVACAVFWITLILLASGLSLASALTAQLPDRRK